MTRVRRKSGRHRVLAGPPPEVLAYWARSRDRLRRRFAASIDPAASMALRQEQIADDEAVGPEVAQWRANR